MLAPKHMLVVLQNAEPDHDLWRPIDTCDSGTAISIPRYARSPPTIPVGSFPRAPSSKVQDTHGPDLLGKPVDDTFEPRWSQKLGSFV